MFYLRAYNLLVETAEEKFEETIRAEPDGWEELYRPVDFVSIITSQIQITENISMFRKDSQVKEDMLFWNRLTMHCVGRYVVWDYKDYALDRIPSIS